MSDREDLNFGDPHVWLANNVLMAATTEDVDLMTSPPYRPVFVLVVRTAPLLGKQATELNVIVNWQQVAGLAGQTRAARGMLPTHLRDQWDALEREVYTESAKVADTGRPE
jgi:hypothetical protein